MKVSIVTITPKQAKALLEKTNEKIQRNPKQRHVSYLKSQIQQGKWQLNGDAIRQDKAGNIIDGQHRLLACIASGKSIETLFIKGLETHLIKTINQGTAARTISDYLSINYSIHKNARTIAGAIQVITSLQNNHTNGLSGGAIGLGKIDAATVDTFLSENPFFVDWAGDVIKQRNQGDKLIQSKHFLAFYYIFSKLSREKAAEFMHKLSTGVNCSLSCPIYVLRKRLIKERNDATGIKFKLKSSLLVAYVYDTWNRYVTGKKGVTQFKGTKQRPKLKLPNLL